MELTDPQVIRPLLERHGFRFTKALGQNFLCAAWVPPRTADCAEVDKETGVLEIGPGVGCLTRELSLRAAKVVSVELDRRLLPVLEETLAGRENVTLIAGDIMKQDIPSLVEREFVGLPRRIVCANLPYQITTPVLTLLTGTGCFQSLTVMIQREVAERICAKENTPAYGAFTILMQWRTQAEKCFDIPSACFFPAPKVTSSVVRLDTRAFPPAEVSDPEAFFRLVRAAFQQRRKTLCNALVHGLGLERETVLSALESLGLDPRIRGETLDIRQFAALSERLN